MNVAAIIPAAGTGKRMGEGIRKPYVMLNQRPVLYYVLAAFDQSPAIGQIVVAVPPGEEQLCQQDIVDKNCFKKPVQIIYGGETRQESVRRLLACVTQDSSMVMIHDGVRPFITPDMVAYAVAETQKFRATVMAVPVKDTIKLVDENTFAKTTLPRECLWSIQTPQTFDRQVIYEAHYTAHREGFIGTDDAVLVERIGVSVKVIMGSYDNIKITTPEDLIVAEALIRAREK